MISWAWRVHIVSDIVSQIPAHSIMEPITQDHMTGWSVDSCLRLSALTYIPRPTITPVQMVPPKLPSTASQWRADMHTPTQTFGLWRLYLPRFNQILAAQRRESPLMSSASQSLSALLLGSWRLGTTNRRNGDRPLARCTSKCQQAWPR